MWGSRMDPRALLHPMKTVPRADRRHRLCPRGIHHDGAYLGVSMLFVFIHICVHIGAWVGIG